MKAASTFETPSAARYLAALCHHFGRKLEAQSNAHDGWVKFPFGRCDMSADETRLTLLVSAEDQARLDQVVHIVTSHLERFAFRENPALIWQLSAT